MDDSQKKSDDSGNLDASNNGSIDTTSPDALSSSGGVHEQPAVGAEKKKGLPLPGFFKKYGHRFNIYLLFFLLILVVAGAILVITAMASKQTKDPTAINSQNLSSDALKQLENTNTTVGDPKQILNVQSNSVFAGSVLIKDSLEVAGQIKVGGPLNLPGITVSGQSTFDQLDVNKSLTIGGDESVQGQLNVKKDLAVSGSGTFGGPVTAPQISTSNLQLLGDLTISNHLVSAGATPSRSIGPAVGPGGTASVSGTDTDGYVNINTGSNAPAGCFVTIYFVSHFSGTPHVMLTPVGSAGGLVNYYVNRDGSSFSICSSTNPPANSSFGFDYFVVN